MATIARPPVRWTSDRLFYSGMGLALALTTFCGFAPSFYLSRWLVAPSSTPPWTGLLYLHGAVFTLWLLLLVVQPLLIAGRNIRLHRTIGVGGAVVAAGMFLLGNLAAIAAMRGGGFIGLGDPYVFYAVPFFSLNSFAATMVLAILWRNRPEAHKRLILLANVGIIGAAIARIDVAPVQAGAPLTFIFLPNLIIVAGMIFDWRTRGRVHPVWIWGGLAMLVSQLAMMAMMGTGAWHGFAETMAGLWAAAPR